MIGVRLNAAMLAVALAAGAGAAQAQQMYRWTDEKGGVHITDTPPPPSAKGVQKQGGAAAAAPTQQVPFELAQAMRDFPVVLYTSPPCKQPCDQARAVLNQRGVPFKEVLIWDEESHEQLKKVAGNSDEVPVLTVGSSVHKGFAQEGYNALLDSARYPRAGILPARSQGAPQLPADYVAPENRAAVPPAEPVKPAEEPKLGPYAPRFSK